MSERPPEIADDARREMQSALYESISAFNRGSYPVADHHARNLAKLTREHGLIQTTTERAAGPSQPISGEEYAHLLGQVAAIVAATHEGRSSLAGERARELVKTLHYFGVVVSDRQNAEKHQRERARAERRQQKAERIAARRQAKLAPPEQFDNGTFPIAELPADAQGVFRVLSRVVPE